jgi:hypothetical protein
MDGYGLDLTITVEVIATVADSALYWVEDED